MSWARLCVLPLTLGLVACRADYTRWEPVGPAQVDDHGLFLDPGVLNAPEQGPVLIQPLESSPAEGSRFAELVRTIGNFACYRALMIQTSAAPPSPVRNLVVPAPMGRLPLRPAGLGPAIAVVAPAIPHVAAARPTDIASVGLTNSSKLIAMFGMELDQLRNQGRSSLAGLALSGGGVRAASFAQGVLQGLHELRLLRQFGYLSSVSGGGYTAAWYVTHSESDEELLRPGSLHLHHIAQHGNYLASGHYSGSTSGYLLNGLGHLASFPYHVLVNGVLDLDQNTGLLRPFYRLGIQRAYLYEQPLTAVPRAGKIPRIRDYSPKISEKPLWICNMNLSLIGDDSHHRNRIGDHFELTPLRAGATAVGYVDTPQADGPYQDAGGSWPYDLEFMQPCHRWMAPDYAAAMSGAAVDARGLLSSWLFYPLSILNLSMGMYVDGWADGWLASDDMHWGTWLWHQLTRPLHASAVLPFTESHARTVVGDKLYLSDGGHIENLGLYALVRRGCRTIVVADATQDEVANRWDDATWVERGGAFDDLRRVEVQLLADFGASVEIDWERLAIGEDGLGLAFVGKIRDLPLMLPLHAPTKLARDVTIIYLKAAFSDENGPQDATSFLNSEKAHDSNFANQSTSNVEWSERQVLSQRELGRRMVRRMESQIRTALQTNGQAP